jgi:hypothetical protein
MSALHFRAVAKERKSSESGGWRKAFHAVHTCLPFPMTIKLSLDFATFEIHKPADLGRADAVDGSEVRLFVLSRSVQAPNLPDRSHTQLPVHG